ncbi:LLM class flavin-dependent oxidoreductase [Roseovarius faecimaris]|uniref:LLM class flavin-dependent oxidoreductase n=1 Tax=Roseovarius faecimaris TaxID=2494550 RepID=A0A6I6J408_9RHOB|nr:MupA/Atu3671 family FMN-dependent luciferase-like monooxygenase [Roseovarius faecimaris]QGX99508.1 LLM class flavin-dependent oxidoreductase [Roseovarius faecimaris]
MTHLTTVLLGDESLTVGCGQHLLDQGHEIKAVVSTDDAVRGWAEGKGLRVLDKASELTDGGFDWLLSIANLKIIPDAVLALARQGAVNFHDGPLPRYAGLNTPAWAIWNGEAQHGITWHLIEGGVDEGDILDQRLIDIAEDETAYSLNSKCYAAAMESFPGVVEQLVSGPLNRTRQDLSQRSYFARDDRPAMGGLLDFAKPAVELARQARALDFGGYRNPLTTPKLLTGETWVAVGTVEAEDTISASEPGTVLEVTAMGLRVASAAGVVHLSGLRDMRGGAVDPASLLQVGMVLSAPEAGQAQAIETAAMHAAKAEPRWTRILTAAQPAPLPLAKAPAKRTQPARHPLEVKAPSDPARLATAVLALARLSTGEDTALIALAGQTDTGLRSAWVPVTAPQEATLGVALEAVSAHLTARAEHGAFAADLFLRDPALAGHGTPDLALNLNEDAPLDGAAVTVSLADTGALVLHVDGRRVTTASAARLGARLTHILERLDRAERFADLTVLPDEEAQLVTRDWNRTGQDVTGPLTIHAAFEAQADRTPDATALIFEDQSLSYAELDARANALAARLQAQGVAPGSHVGLMVARGPLLLIGALAILKAGGAYVPLDPAYPADRLAHYVTDSRASVIVTEAALRDSLPTSDAAVVLADETGRQDGRVSGGAGPEDLAYVIYTSGSTGTPKGVMIEHRNVANFFTGMDGVVDHDKGGVWMAVTSLAFDISVLELFYTLARGFKLVLVSDEGRASVSGGPITGSGKRADFSLYYWSNDCDAGRGKYELLLEGAKFADANGFDALWTPERHFHAFGGPYPNPAVTGAAVAAITTNLEVRAGSCVAPLHHPARIAEEWSVIDNLTNGRTGLAMASGWHPNDFVLRPENAPPNNNDAMFATIDQVRRLWRGEAVEFAGKDGAMVPVVTQPRPVSPELNIWVTIAGNPATWKRAGEIGANVLTHLLGQSIEEVGEKITLYHQALRDNGFDPAEKTVTVMLHTLIGEDRDRVMDIAKGPLKDYLRSAAGLIKQYAWAFPAFKKPEGVSNPFELDLGELEPEEMEAILDFAFERYFFDAGLFGTVEDGIARVEQLKRLGVGEIACLIDYGIDNAHVLEGLDYLNAVRERSNSGAALREDDFSIAAQLIRHRVTHMQCTPSMARMLTMNDEARMALGGVQHLYLGGEALPGSLVDELRRVTRAKITNMYGPTETTIWSATHAIDGDGKGQAAMPVGKPLANQTAYVLNDAGQPVPVGVAGELLIGGAGVARGYWQRDALTAERFVPDHISGQGRLYRTGDLVRWRADGRLEFLGRTDHQVKIRGQRIELGEIEARIAAFPGVREAVVIAREAATGEPELAAYVIADALNEAALRRDLAANLPEVMVPRHIVGLERFPLTPNKKIDRKALPAPQAATASEAVESAPKTGAAAEVAAIWTRILGVPNPRGSDSFFDLGGHSLLAVQAHRELRAELDVPRLSITDIFRFPTLNALAAHLDTLMGTTPEQAEADTSGADEAERSETMSRRRAMRAARGRRAG